MSVQFHRTDQNISKTLKDIAQTMPAQGLTTRELLERLGESGLLILSLVLTVPFLLPVSIPGTSTPFGLLIALIGLSLLTHRTPWLPNRLMNRRLSAENMVMILERGAQFFDRIERWTKPRLLLLTQSTLMHSINGILIIVSAILMMMPLPLPLANALPAYGVLFLTVGNMGRDGALLIAGYTMVVLTVVYFGLVALLGVTGIKILLTNIGF